MQVSDVADLVRGHLLEGEALTEEPSDAYGDRMLTITTAASTAHVYILGDMYGIATLNVLEAWRASDTDQYVKATIDAVLDCARHNTKPLEPKPPQPTPIEQDHNPSRPPRN